MMTFEQLRRQGRAARSEYADDLNRHSTMIDPDAPLVYVYTSGTTGPSKGVVLTHRNVSCEMDALIATGSFNFPYRSVSYLPLAHLAERIWSLYMPLRVGGHVFCCPDPAALGRAFANIGPHSSSVCHAYGRSCAISLTPS